MQTMRLHYQADAPFSPVWVGKDGSTLYGTARTTECGTRSKHGLNVTSDPAAVNCPKCIARF